MGVLCRPRLVLCWRWACNLTQIVKTELVACGSCAARAGTTRRRACSAMRHVSVEPVLWRAAAVPRERAPRGGGHGRAGGAGAQSTNLCSLSKLSLWRAAAVPCERAPRGGAPAVQCGMSVLSLCCGMLQLCRASGHHEAAGTAALEALARGVPGAGLERARLLWARDQQHGAIVRLQEARTPPIATP